jgi:hypothetical protein
MDMEDEELPTLCQLTSLPAMMEPPGRLGSAWQFRNRLKRFAKRRLVYLQNWLRRRSRPSLAAPGAQAQPTPALQAGDRVRVRSRQEIQASLNEWNALGGCGFMEEMWAYCGTTQQVLKPVTRFLDERDYKIKRGRRVVILEDVTCQGTLDFGPCDRNCFFFWREEWLEKIP